MNMTFSFFFLVVGGWCFVFQSCHEPPDLFFGLSTTFPGALYPSAWAHFHACGGRIYWLRTRHAVPQISSEDGPQRRGPTKNFHRNPHSAEKDPHDVFRSSGVFLGLIYFKQMAVRFCGRPWTVCVLHHLLEVVPLSFGCCEPTPCSRW